jgi:RNA polymerase sigma factor (sigma-70 family)
MAISHHQLRKLAIANPVESTDGQLLEAFVSRGDSTALEALVLRHGPMVWGVCCRILNHHDAEDAFQATFLILIRKAATVKPRDMIGNWLYGVAYQTALNARTRIARRAVREVQVREIPEPPLMERHFWSDLQPLLDRELSRLPNKYRAAIVLCDLEGKTRKEAAQELGWPEGSVASRLARGRAMLANRMARHGLAISAAVLEAELTQKALRAEPSSVMTSTIKTVTQVVAGPPDSGVISVEVSNLTERVLKIMFLTKLKPMMAALVLAVLVVTGIVAVGLSAPGDEQPQPAKTDPPSPQKEKPLPAPQKADTGVPKDLLKAKLDAAKEAYQEIWKTVGEFRRIQPNLILPVSGPEEVYNWSVRWLNAQLDMSDKKDERIAALEEHIKRMNQLKAKVNKMTPELIPAYHNSAAAWYLAEAEVWLAKEKAK